MQCGYIDGSQHREYEGIGNIVPQGVIAVESINKPPLEPIFPAEMRLACGANQSRFEEFSRARTCAHKALTLLGEKPVSILRGKRREPIWPKNLVGSITHCDEYCCAVVAKKNIGFHLGIDAEITTSFAPRVTNNITTDFEKKELAKLNTSIDFGVVLFSAKEAIFKAWYPLTQRWLNFRDAEIAFDLSNEEFEAKILLRDSGFKGDIKGRFLVKGTRVYTLAIINNVDLICGSSDTN